MAKIMIKPAAELEARQGDEILTPKQALLLGIFKDLKKKPNLLKLPGTFKLRHYRPNEIVLRQGEAGCSAFYILTTVDLLQLRQNQLVTASQRDQQDRLNAEIAGLRDGIDTIPLLKHGDRTSIGTSFQPGVMLSAWSAEALSFDGSAQGTFREHPTG
jgi:hypothetical protein